MLDEPTRGIDVSAKREIYARSIGSNVKVWHYRSLVRSARAARNSRRIVVLCEGRKTGEFVRANATEEALMQAAVLDQTD